MWRVEGELAELESGGYRGAVRAKIRVGSFEQSHEESFPMEGLSLDEADATMSSIMDQIRDKTIRAHANVLVRANKI